MDILYSRQRKREREGKQAAKLLLEKKGVKFFHNRVKNFLPPKVRKWLLRKTVMKRRTQLWGNVINEPTQILKSKMISVYGRL